MQGITNKFFCRTPPLKKVSKGTFAISSQKTFSQVSVARVVSKAHNPTNYPLSSGIWLLAFGLDQSDPFLSWEWGLSLKTVTIKRKEISDAAGICSGGTGKE